MKALLESIENLKRSKVKRAVDFRLKEFEKTGKKPNSELFKELCFCILTANFNAERSIRIQSEMGNGFLALSKPRLAKRLRALGHRYPNARAKYILEARKHRDFLKQILASFSDEKKLRDWLVKNVKGIGYKEASHFLRNIGYKDSAVIDFHIIDILARYRLIRRPKLLDGKRYLEIEDLLREIAGELDMSLAELDLYLWFAETGKVLK